MEGLSELLSVVFFASLVIFIIAFLVLSLAMQRQKRNPEYKSKHNWKHITLYSLLTLIASLVLFSFTSSHTPEAKKEAAESSSESVKKASIKKVDKKKAAAKKSSAKAQKQELKKERAKNEKINFKEYKQDLTKFPSETHNAITKAYWSSNLGQTVVVLNDKALEANPAQLKMIAHSAWKSTESVYNANSPMPSDVNYIVDVEDSTGNQIATTSAFGSFKFEGE
ncbi:hypothetical protein ACN2AV_00965 [Lentilactobacillus buchneri subsp. silagei]|uniref:hypothetical protein n=1 Tax=Lentilactobacillus buchneri TaxID=1581 RepID=UPI003AFB06A3